MAVDPETRLLIVETVNIYDEKAQKRLDDRFTSAEKTIRSEMNSGLSLSINPINDKLAIILNSLERQQKDIDDLNKRLGVVEDAQKFTAGIITATGTVTAFLAWLIPQVVAYVTKGH